jgi:hypothetical protein
MRPLPGGGVSATAGTHSPSGSSADRWVALMPILLAFALALCLALIGTRVAAADPLTAQDLSYLQARYGLTPKSAVIAELTANEQAALHSAIDDLKRFPERRDRQVRNYLAWVYRTECGRWARRHPGQPCSPASDPSVQPGKQISDRLCAGCHLFGTDTAASFYTLANRRDWNAHKVSHALRHTPAMVPLKLTTEMLGQLAAYINSLK